MSNKRNKELADKFRGMPCIVCGSIMTVGDHIKHYANQKHKDIEQNMWPLCIFGANHHHEEKHLIGLNRFVEKYGLHKALKEKGFYFEELRNRWIFKF